MGTSFQGTIKIKNGKIKYIQKGKDFVHLDNENKSHFFRNAYALPGFSDSHGHIASFGSKINGLNLSLCLSSEDCAEFASKKTVQKGNWIIGSGWNNELWKKNNFPDKNILDFYFPDTPVFFSRIDGHVAWVNSLGLKIAKIDKFSPNPVGGIIEKDKSGNPSGILHDNAIDLIKSQIQKYSKTQLIANFQAAFNELISYGITSVHDMDVHPELFDIYRELDRENKIPLRIYSFVSGHNNEWLKFQIEPEINNKFNIVGVKFYADGSLGSRSAAMLDDYSDKKGNKGIFLIEESDLFQRVNKAKSLNFDVAVHAIGDAANRMVLKVYSNSCKESGYSPRPKLRIEHAQHIHPDDKKLFADFPIFASIQPVHCTSDAATISEKRLGERCSYAYPWKSLIDCGANIACGSDFPIESPNPLLGIQSLTKRIPLGQNKAWYKDEILDLDSAVKSYTQSPHSATSLDLNLGCIKEGFLADLVILDNDIFSNNDPTKINVLATIINGERVF